MFIFSVMVNEVKIPILKNTTVLQVQILDEENKPLNKKYVSYIDALNINNNDLKKLTKCRICDF